MKNFTMLIFVALLLSSCQKTQTQTQAQSQSGSDPIMGYDKVTWGTSIQDVRRIYGISNSVLTNTVPNHPNITSLLQEDVSDSIVSRVFNFIGDKLCQVQVDYKMSSVTEEDLLNALKVRFGESSDFTVEHYGSMSFQETTFKKYSPELVVRLARIYDSTENEESFIVLYTGQRFIDEYEASKVEL